VSATLYGVRVLPTFSINLVSIDIKTAATTIIGPPLQDVDLSHAKSTVDTVNQILYFVSETHPSNLIGVHLKNCSMVYNITLPFLPYYNGVCDFNINTGEVFVSGFSYPTYWEKHIVSVNPKTGAISKDIAVIAELGGGGVGNTQAFDPKNNVLWLKIAQNNQVVNVHVDVNTGQITNVLDDLHMRTMDYDPTTGLIYGFGFTTIPIFLSLDSKTNIYTVLGNITGYGIMYNHGALDYVLQKYYIWLYHPGSPLIYLVEYDLTTNNVTNSVALDQTNLSCLHWVKDQ